MSEIILNNYLSIYYKKFVLYTNLEKSADIVFDKIKEFDLYRENFWNKQENKYKVTCIYSIPEWEKLELEIVKKHKELFQWLKNWWFDCSKSISSQHMFETTYAYLVDINVYGYINRWKEL